MRWCGRTVTLYNKKKAVTSGLGATAFFLNNTESVIYYSMLDLFCDNGSALAAYCILGML